MSVFIAAYCQASGAHPRGARGPPPWDLKNTGYIFSVSSVKLRDCIFEVCFFLAFLYIGGLRKPAG